MMKAEFPLVLAETIGKKTIRVSFLFIEIVEN